MPQKLIRLTSDSGDGVFSGLFSEDLIIKEDSEICLQSLSVERASTIINIDGGNNEITFNNVLPENDISTAVIPYASYNRSNNTELLQSITDALARSASMEYNDSEMNVQWKVSEINGFTNIAARISPFWNVNNFAGKLTAAGQPTNGKVTYNTAMRYQNPTKLNVTNAEDVKIGGTSEDPADGGGLENYLYRDTTSVVGNVNECNVFSAIPFIKSTGALRLRLNRLIQDATNNTAFLMGLTNEAGLEKLRAGTITETDFVYAITCPQPSAANTAFMKVKAGLGATYVDTTAYPVNYGAGSRLERDILEITLVKGVLKGQHWVNGVVAANEFTELEVTEGENLYFCVAPRSGEATCRLDKVQVSLDPWVNFKSTVKSNTVRKIPESFQPTSIIGPIVPPLQGSSTAVEPTIKLSPELMTHIGFPNSVYLSSKHPPNQPQLKISSITTATVLYPNPAAASGFSASARYDLVTGFSWRGSKAYNSSDDANTYIIESQTFTLDSYDSYGLNLQDRRANGGGSRRNILATIPIGEVPIGTTGAGIIQYEPSTLYYIAIKNRGDIVTRQIRFRLLNNQYQPIKTEGLTQMVILVKDPY